MRVGCLEQVGQAYGEVGIAHIVLGQLEQQRVERVPEPLSGLVVRMTFAKSGLRNVF